MTFFDSVLVKVTPTPALSPITFEVRAPYEEVAAQGNGTVFQTGFAVFHFEDIHHVRLFAQNMDDCFGDLFAYYLILVKSDVDAVLFGFHLPLSTTPVKRGTA